MSKIKKQKSKYNDAAKLALIAGIINFCLALVEIVVGFHFGVLVIIASGFHYLFDTAFMAVTFFSFRYASKPADKEHPFGHERMEYISALFLSAVLLVFSIEIIVEGVSRIISPNNGEINLALIIVLSVVILTKVILSFVYYLKNKKIKSLTLQAAYFDSIFDSVSSALVLGGLLLSTLTTFSIDGILSILIACLMIYNSVKILKVSINNLMGSQPKKELKQKIIKKLKAYEEIVQVHELLIHNYGDSNLYVSSHIVLRENYTLEQTNVLLDKIISDFKNENINIVIQIEVKKTS